MLAYYNDNDRHAAAWLRELIKAGLITDGDVDERSIADVKGTDLRGYDRVHFFAGIGGWDYALQLAGWPTDRHVWTGSCPCQPFSSAGQRRGYDDERDLWPEFFRLIQECKPDVVLGEQVSSAEVVGTQLEVAFLIAVQTGDYARANKLAKQLAQKRGFHYWPRWVSRIQADLETIDYSFRFAVLGAHSVSAPHIRQRLYWVADGQGVHGGLSVYGREPRKEAVESFGSSENNRLAESACRQEHAPTTGGLHSEFGEDSGMGDARLIQEGWSATTGEKEGAYGEPSRPSGNYWSNSILTLCGDGKARRIESGLAALVDGLPGRVGLLRGYGNAIVPQVAAKFIRAFYEANK